LKKNRKKQKGKIDKRNRKKQRKGKQKKRS